MRWVFGTLILFFSLSCTDSGGHWQHYRISALSEAKERNWTIILHFHDPKNPRSEEQRLALENIIKDPLFKKVGAYRVISGSELGLEKMFGIQSAATILVLKGGSEKGRSTGVTNEADLKSLMMRGL